MNKHTDDYKCENCDLGIQSEELVSFSCPRCGHGVLLVQRPTESNELDDLLIALGFEKYDGYNWSINGQGRGAALKEKAAIQELLDKREAEARRAGKITVLKELAGKKPLPKTDEDWTADYQRGWDSMQSKVKFELQRLKGRTNATVKEGE